MRLIALVICAVPLFLIGCDKAQAEQNLGYDCVAEYKKQPPPGTRNLEEEAARYCEAEKASGLTNDEWLDQAVKFTKCLTGGMGYIDPDAFERLRAGCAESSGHGGVSLYGTSSLREAATYWRCVRLGLDVDVPLKKNHPDMTMSEFLVMVNNLLESRKPVKVESVHNHCSRISDYHGQTQANSSP